MGKIVELRPRRFSPGDPSREATHQQASIEEATSRLMVSVGDLIGILEASHDRIRALIDTIPDAEAAARLSRDHAKLSAALWDAKEKVATLAKPEP